MEPCVVLVDGEHYPPVVARAVGLMRARGEHPVVALLVGGSEKLGQVPMELGVPVEVAPPGGAEAALASLLGRTGLTRVVDLSDDPVLDYVARMRLASVALWRGARYEGADFAFSPPDRSLHPAVPSVAIMGTGKRTGKTAIGGHAARTWQASGRNPVVIAMGRGGPPEPEVLGAGEYLDAARLMAFLAEGRHAASDYIEDALTSGVATVGAWRAGGGLAGAMAYSNFPAALAAAEALDPGMLLLEGSGAAIPPSGFDGGVLVVNAGIDPGYLCGYFGLYRLLLADLVVFTMWEETLDGEQRRAVERCARSRPLTQPKVVSTVLRPHPLADVSGKKIWLGTTANEQAGPALRRHLEETYGCNVVALSHALARRDALRRDLDAAAGVDAVVVELKAAAVDVVTRWGMERGVEVIYLDNRPMTVAGDAPLEELLEDVAVVAAERFRHSSR